MKKIFFQKKWEVTIMEVKSIFGTRFKVTRRLPELYVAETKIFRSRKKAEQQLHDWLN